VRGRIEHWCWRGAMDIEGGGEALIAQLVERGLVRDVADFYKLTEDELLQLERMGEKSARNFSRELKRASRAIFGGSCSGWAFFTSVWAGPRRSHAAFPISTQ